MREIGIYVMQGRDHDVTLSQRDLHARGALGQKLDALIACELVLRGSDDGVRHGGDGYGGGGSGKTVAEGHRTPQVIKVADVGRRPEPPHSLTRDAS